MCYYVTATMAPDSDESAVRRLARAVLLRWEPMDNLAVVRQLRSGERYFSTSCGTCDCDTDIGISARTDRTLPPPDQDYLRRIKKLKKKGWTDTEIEEWLRQTKADAARRHNEAVQRLLGPHPELRRWIEFVSTVLTGGHAEWIGILLHWYRGKVATEAVPAVNRHWVCLADFGEDYLLNAKEDILHTVTLGRTVT